MRYREWPTTAGTAYVREDWIPRRQDVDALLFDCDGVLIDVRSSYDAAIREAVRYLVAKLVQRPVTRPVSRRLISRFRQSGGFNNDWDTVCAILWGMVVHLPDPWQQDFLRAHEELCGRDLRDAAERLRAYVGRMRRPKTWDEVLDLRRPFPSVRVRARLYELAERADSSGLPSVERVIRTAWSLSDRQRAVFDAFRHFLGYPGLPEQSVVIRVFNELFYGADYCREQFGWEPQIHLGAGLMEAERPIVTPATLERLERRLGRARLGIVSGRSSVSARRTLGGRLDRFHPEALIFLEDEWMRAPRREVMGKPSPYGLLRAARALGAFRHALYVGDSAEDAIMVERARAYDARFEFAGVYRAGQRRVEAALGDEERRKLAWFRERGAAVVLPSVNALPDVLEAHLG